MLKMRVGRFVVIGVINVSINYGLYVFLLLMGVRYHLALTASYVVGIVIGYIANRNWTFSDHEYASSSFIRYIVTYLFLYSFNSLMLMLLVENNFLEPIIAQLLLLGIVASLSYIIQKSWVFKNKPY